MLLWWVRGMIRSAILSNLLLAIYNRFPLTASEVLSADIPSIQNMLLPEDKLYQTVTITVDEIV